MPMETPGTYGGNLCKQPCHLFSLLLLGSTELKLKMNHKNIIAHRFSVYVFPSVELILQTFIFPGYDSFCLYFIVR